jgi:tyrosine-protein phosphatase YwqE
MGLLSNIFGKKLPPIDLDLIQVDMHSHLIPGIDDGAKTMEQSIEMIKKFASLGYKKVVTTPHVMSDFYRNTPEIILSGMENVRAELKKQNVDIEFFAAAEYYLDHEFVEKVKAKEVLSFSGNHVLFELSFSAEQPNVNEAIFELISNGYQPILAHVERYSFYQNRIDRIKEIREKGALLQLNINSLSGHYGPDVKKLAEKLIDLELIDVISSDCHRIDHLDTLEKTLTNPYLHKLVESGRLVNVSL